MDEIKSVEDLDVFQRSHKLTLELYKITEDFPSSEKFGLLSQIRRASSSICANLLEGSYRNNTNTVFPTSYVPRLTFCLAIICCYYYNY